MNKYDFDFRKIEDVLYEVLGIANSTDIISLKTQISDSFNALSNAIDEKSKKIKNPDEKRIQFQKDKLMKELASIEKERDLNKVLKKCVIVRYLTLLSLEVKVRPNDSNEEQAEKKKKRNEIFAVSRLVNSVPSIVDFMQIRDTLLKYIDCENRIVPFNQSPPKLLNLGVESYPSMKLDIQFQPRPRGFQDEYGKCLEDAGIYTYKFGEVVYSALPNKTGEYTQELAKKLLVGIIKKNEFGELKKYTVLMNEISRNVPPEFYRDILFSDILLRNAQNNLGFLGVPGEFPEDPWYGYGVAFNDLGLEDMLRAIYFENNPEFVTVESNFPRVKSVNGAYALMQDKMEQALKEIGLIKETEEHGRSIGDD